MQRFRLLRKTEFGSWRRYLSESSSPSTSAANSSASTSKSAEALHSVKSSNVKLSTANSPSSVVRDSTQATKKASRLDRLLARSPKFLHKHLQSLRSAPVSHISAFLILHELTAIIPLFGLAGAFHYYNWLPPYFAEGAWVVAGVEKFGRYARRKGWVTESDEQEAEREVKSGEGRMVESLGARQKSSPSRTSRWYNRGEGGVRWIVEFATAYAIVKAFLIPRLLISVWGAPWFARWSVIPLVNLIKGSRKRSTLRNP